jgi:hypothetical protein
MRRASPALEAFIDETIRLGAKKGYHPTVFIGMRDRYGTLEAMKRLVRNGEVQSGFRKLTELGLQEWTVEAAILKFRSEFDPPDIECAAWRLDQVNKAS